TKVANAVKAEGKASRYVVLPAEAIDAAIDDMDATNPTGRVQSEPPTPTKPDGDGGGVPVGFRPTTPVLSNPTGRVEPVGFKPTGHQQDARAQAPVRARDNTSHGNTESPSEILKDSLSEKEPEREVVRVNGSAIYGPDFTLDFGAIDMAAALCGVEVQR